MEKDNVPNVQSKRDSLRKTLNGRQSSGAKVICGEDPEDPEGKQQKNSTICRPTNDRDHTWSLSTVSDKKKTRDPKDPTHKGLRHKLPTLVQNASRNEINSKDPAV